MHVRDDSFQHLGQIPIPMSFMKLRLGVKQLLHSHRSGSIRMWVSIGIEGLLGVIAADACFLPD